MQNSPIQRLTPLVQRKASNPTISHTAESKSFAVIQLELRSTREKGNAGNNFLSLQSPFEIFARLELLISGIANASVQMFTRPSSNELASPAIALPALWPAPPLAIRGNKANRANYYSQSRIPKADTILWFLPTIWRIRIISHSIYL